MKFSPAPGIVLVEPIEEETKGLKLTESPKGQVGCGKVLAVGLTLPGDDDIPAELIAKVGDIVYFLKYEGAYDTFEYENKPYFVVKFGDIRGVMRGK